MDQMMVGAYAITYVLLLAFAVRSIRASARVSPRLEHWRSVSGMIVTITAADVDDTHLQDSVKDVLRQVLSDEPGHGYPDRIPSAMQPTEIALDDNDRSYKDAAGNFVLATLVATAGVLAAYFLKQAPDDSAVLDHFGPIFLANGVTLLTALILQAMYVRKRAVNSQTLKIAYTTLGALKSPIVKDVDPKLAGALAQVAREMEKWSERQEQRNIEKIQGLTNEVRSLATSIKDLFKEVIAQRDDDSPDETAVVVSRSVQAAMEQLSARFDVAAAGLTEAVNGGVPVAVALEAASQRMANQVEEFLSADHAGAISSLHQATSRNSEAIGALPHAVAESVASALPDLKADMMKLHNELTGSRQATEALPSILAPQIVAAIPANQPINYEQLSSAITTQLDLKFGAAVRSLSDRLAAEKSRESESSTELMSHAKEINELLQQIEKKLGTNGHGQTDKLTSVLERLDESVKQLDQTFVRPNDKSGFMRRMLGK